MLLGQQFVWSANWRSTRLHRARDLCRLTLNAEMADLSLAIFRDTINGPMSAPFQGARVNSDPERDDTMRGDRVLDADFMTNSGMAEDIVATWDTLEPEWRAKGVAADAIFATLLECVLPANRLDEVFVFAVSPNATLGPDLLTPPKRTTAGHPESTKSNNEPETSVPGQRRGQEIRAERNVQSLALRLVELAVTEKRIDVLTHRLVEREKTASNPLTLRLIHLLLARQTNDDQRLGAVLKKLAQARLVESSVSKQPHRLANCFPSRCAHRTAQASRRVVRPVDAPVSKVAPRATSTRSQTFADGWRRSAPSSTNRQGQRDRRGTSAAHGPSLVGDRSDGRTAFAAFGIARDCDRLRLGRADS